MRKKSTIHILVESWKWSPREVWVLSLSQEPASTSWQVFSFFFFGQRCVLIGIFQMIHFWQECMAVSIIISNFLQLFHISLRFLTSGKNRQPIGKKKTKKFSKSLLLCWTIWNCECWKVDVRLLFFFKLRLYIWDPVGWDRFYFAKLLFLFFFNHFPFQSFHKGSPFVYPKIKSCCSFQLTFYCFEDLQKCWKAF